MRNKQDKLERFGLLGITRQTELISLAIFSISFWVYILFYDNRSYAVEQAIGYNIEYEPTQMH